VAALLLAWRYMHLPEERGEHPLDVLGLALLSPALAAIVYGFAEAGTRGGFGNGHVIVPLTAGVALLAAYAFHALRTRIEPIIDLRLFRVRSFNGSAGVMFIGGLSIFGAMLLLPLYYQQARGQSALDAGLLLAPQGLGMMIALTIVGRLTDRIGPRPIVLVGLVIASLATIPYALVGPDTSEWALGAWLVVRGAGLGAVFVPATPPIRAGWPPRSVTLSGGRSASPRWRSCRRCSCRAPARRRKPKGTHQRASRRLLGP
jgi:hypothetical protein